MKINFVKWKTLIKLQLTKVRLYRTLIKPVLMYGSETWVLTKGDLQLLKGKYLRKFMDSLGKVESRESVSYTHLDVYKRQV